MSRLPTPRGDKGAWRDIFNDFLSVQHNSDGPLKASGTIATKANDNAVVHLAGAETVSTTKTCNTSPVAPAPASSLHATTKLYLDAAAAGGTPAAASGVKARIRLAGDLGATASAPTVPAVGLERW
jgi:hypothetical protein